MKKGFVSFFIFLIIFFPVKMYSQSENRKNLFIDELLSKMTLDEKLGQLNLPSSGDIVTGQMQSSNIADKIRKGQVGGLFNIKGVEKIKEAQRIAIEESRLKIPLLFGMDVIHGYETVFPIPIGMAATWDMKSVEESARIAALEASADGICWTFSPMVDVSRDPRWGRVSEGSGEDPYLGGQIAKAMIKGYQGDNSFSTNNHILACVKHYALYGASEAGRDYNTVDMSRQRMFNEYMYPYQAAVNAGVGSVMASFNEVDGVPATANKWLMTEVLRNNWGFDGFVVTDYTGINEMVDHGIGDLRTVAARALKAGIDMDMVGEGFITTLKQSLEENNTSMKEIDNACRRILEAKFKLGLFDDPYKFCDTNRPSKDIYTKDNRETARRIAAESFVLLKNDNILPLKKDATIALIGPLADAKTNMTGTWSVAADHNKSISLLEGLRSVSNKKEKVLYAKGSHLTLDIMLEERSTVFGKTLGRKSNSISNDELINEAISVSKNADVIIAALGESAEMSGESSSRTNIDIPDAQKKLLQELVKTGKPIVLVLFTGRPLTLTWENENIPSILNVWFPGSEAGLSICDVLFGDINPSGKLVATFPQNVGQIPLYYNHKNTGRPLKGEWFEKFRSNYLDVSNEPLFPFGYGLSYTRFEYDEIKLSSDILTPISKIEVSIVLKNTGKYDGAEVVQLYIRDIVGSTTRPVKELKDFQKVFLKAGESKEIKFSITPEMLKFYDYDLNYIFEPGDFELMIGGNSRDTKNRKFTLINK